MNELLEIYIASLDYPNVSGAEHLELLNIRDQVEEIVNTFSTREKRELREEDKKMLINMATIYQEISRFIDLSNYRSEHGISPHQWWWYLDVLSFLPDDISSNVA
ncbi:hypothetical protein IQE94_09960 [Synechocystis sp. PCC 7339]|uniref:hypothetical protein n=1 Tax=Synechocystis sp. PCC 7339 TaxID=2782213 RepID=UPI001CC10670|nr:hypothetical protein [Synechocystis sp. PCC 7339]UAJ71495.1 hypothetical protein IQE94_09960 [Synechocystis sp. PCC 7339]